MNQQPKPLSWQLWHPHQALWNWDLLKVIRNAVRFEIVYKVIAGIIIVVDTIILYMRAMVRRVARRGLTSLFFTPAIPENISIIYFDLGTHKEAKELVLMVDKILPHICQKFNCYAFEACQESFEKAQEILANRENVKLINKALCYQIPIDGKIRLYKDKKVGLGNSLYRQSETYEETEATRLSDWLHQNNIDLQNYICLLRMNIEGAEYEVLQDLVNSGLAKYIDGYYGMWDDLSKINRQRDEEFRAFLSDHQIDSVTFNGRDLNWFFRIKCIEYDINTSVQVGLQRILNQIKVAESDVK